MNLSFFQPFLYDSPFLMQEINYFTSEVRNSAPSSRLNISDFSLISGLLSPILIDHNSDAQLYSHLQVK